MCRGRDEFFETTVKICILWKKCVIEYDWTVNLSPCSTKSYFFYLPLFNMWWKLDSGHLTQSSQTVSLCLKFVDINPDEPDSKQKIQMTLDGWTVQNTATHTVQRRDDAYKAACLQTTDIHRVRQYSIWPYCRW